MKRDLRSKQPKRGLITSKEIKYVRPRTKMENIIHGHSECNRFDMDCPDDEQDLYFSTEDDRVRYFKYARERDRQE